MHADIIPCKSFWVLGVSAGGGLDEGVGGGSGCGAGAGGAGWWAGGGWGGVEVEGGLRQEPHARTEDLDLKDPGWRTSKTSPRARYLRPQGGQPGKSRGLTRARLASLSGVALAEGPACFRNRT